MKFGVPWRAKGIRADARETAAEAARRAGMSLDDWLNSIIMQQAAQAGIPPYGSPQQPAAQPDPQALAAVNGRLDDLTRRIEQFTGNDPPAYAPQRPAPMRGPDHRAELIGRLDQYVQNARPQPQPAPHAQQPHAPPPPPMPPRRAPARRPAPPALDQALADIAARQQALNGGAPAPRRAAPLQQPAQPVQPVQPVQPQVNAYAPPAARAQAQQAQAAQAQQNQQVQAPLPAQDLSGLEDQLRKITDQIETLRQPGVAEAINALRAELGEIGHALDEAMPRQSIDTIERQIQGLTQRIAEGRQNGIDHGALANIERGLGEVRDALQGLTPAENLIGFNDAVAGLAQKIDLIVAQKDPETMAQLETAITTLRSMANHVASNDAVGALAAEVQSLSEKVDYIAQASANADALSSLEHRIDALGQALAERAQSGNAVPPRLEALVQSLGDKIEQIQAAQQAHGDMAAGHLDDRIATVMERLDASDSRIGQLEAIERGLSEVLAHIQQQEQVEKRPGADASAVHALKHDFAQAQDALKDALKYDIAQSQQALKYDLAQAQDALKNDLVLSQDELKGDIARTQDALEQVHGTLGELVSRLAAIEQGIRNEARTATSSTPAPATHDDEPLELTQPVGRVAVRVIDDAPGMAAFDDMPPPRSKAAAAPAPQCAVEPEPLAPPAQPAADHQYAQAADAHDGGQDDYGIEPAAGAHGGEQHDDAQGAEQHEAEHNGSLPPAPQLEAQLEALRAHAAAQARAHAAEAPRAETPAPSAPQRDWTPEPPLAPKRMAAGHGPINPNLPPDEPLEPGSGPPPLRANPAARIAASEADLDHRRPVPATDSASGSKLSFIAAARRAAQAAMLQDPKTQRAAEIAAHDDTAPTASPKRSRMMRRVKSLFVAASIVALVVGSVQIAATMLNLGKPDAPAKTSRGHLSLDQRADGTPTASIVRPSQQIASVQSPASITETAPAMTPPTASIDLLAPPDQTVRIATVPAADPRRTQADAAQPQDSSSADITGSIPEAAADRSTANPLAPAVDQRADLPAAIGSARLREAAAAGDSAAAYEVAMRFADGRGVPADLSMAARWYERAASKGLAPAEFRLASMLEKGQGVKKNLARARSLYFAAARQGNAKAMHNLAVLFAEGVEGKPDYSAAVRWFRDAARHGVSDSQYNLGILYARGIGVEKSLTESYKWFALAAKHGDKEAAKKRDDVASHMDESDLAAARRLVAKFAPAPQPKQATTVAAPPGGWDKATAAQGGAFTVGKR